MDDIRNVPVGNLIKKITGMSKAEANRQQVLSELAKAAVWHSLWTGQVTPAIALVGAVRGKDKESIVLYLTKFGNIKYSEKGGIKHTMKHEQSREAADVWFEDAPTLEDEFPATPKQYRDMSMQAVIKHILARAEEVQKHGKSIIFSSDEEKQLFEKMKTLAI